MSKTQILNKMEDHLSHSYSFFVTEKDIDELNHVNNVTYVQWIQDAAIAHWSLIAPEHVKQNYVWMIVRHEIDYRRQGILGDELLVKTRVLTAEKASSIRLVQIFRKNDLQLLVESKTTWVMMDSVTHRPARITEEIREIFLGSGAK
jgi:acyl-CoA thioester hydrolase